MGKKYPPEVVVACLQHNIDLAQLQSFWICDGDVFLILEAGAMWFEISSLPADMLEKARGQALADPPAGGGRQPNSSRGHA